MNEFCMVMNMSCMGHNIFSAHLKSSSSATSARVERRYTRPIVSWIQVFLRAVQWTMC
jgi:hypothetical protein